MAVSRRSLKWMLGGAAIFGAAALVWSALAVPTLVKYPTDVDITTHYAGTFKLYVDPATGAPLAKAQDLPLTIDRHIEASGKESGSSRAVVTETISQKAGPLASTQTNGYVLDRRSMQNVTDGRAYSFDPANTVDRSGSYRLQLPMDTKGSSQYQIYKNETGASYPLIGDTASPTTNVAGLKLSNFTASAKEVPLTPAYLAGLKKIVPLPDTVTLAQLKVQFAAKGVNLDSVLAGVVGAMSPQDGAALTAALSAPIKLSYVNTFDGRVAVDPETGTEVEVAKITETIAAKPVIDPAVGAGLQGLLTKYASAPAVQAAIPVLTTLTAAPATPLFTLDYAQTPASVAEVAKESKDMRSQIALAERWVPFTLAGLATLALLLAAGTWLRQRGVPFHRPSAAAPSQPAHA